MHATRNEPTTSDIIECFMIKIEIEILTLCDVEIVSRNFVTERLGRFKTCPRFSRLA